LAQQMVHWLLDSVLAVLKALTKARHWGQRMGVTMDDWKEQLSDSFHKCPYQL
jgi:hypothetical protein